MTEIATIDWFGRWETSVFSENTAIFEQLALVQLLREKHVPKIYLSAKLLCLLKIVLHVTAIVDAIFDLVLIISVSFNSLTLKIVTVDGRK